MATTIEKWRKTVDTALQTYKGAKAQVAIEKARLSDSRGRLEATETARQIVQDVAQAIQQIAHSRLASVVSKCLETVFVDTYDFHILFDKKRGKTEARLIFKKDGHDMEPVDSSGGGVIDVAAFALRLSCLVLTNPKQRKVLVMDEPFRFLSKEYRPAMRELLLSLAADMGVQFIFVTHEDEFTVGEVVELG